MKRALALAIGVCLLLPLAATGAQAVDTRSSQSAAQRKAYSNFKGSTTSKPTRSVRTGRIAKPNKVHGSSLSAQKSSTASKPVSSLRYNLNRTPANVTGQLPGKIHRTGTAHPSDAGKVGLKDTLRAAATAAQQRHKSVLGTGQPSGPPGAVAVGKTGFTDQNSKPSGALQAITNPPEPLRDNSRPAQAGMVAGASSSSSNSGQPGALTVGKTGGPLPTQDSTASSSNSAQPGALTVGKTFVVTGQPAAKGSDAPSPGQPSAATVGNTGVTGPPSVVTGPLPPFGTTALVLGAVAPGAPTLGNTGIVQPPPTPEPTRAKPRDSAQSGPVGKTGILTAFESPVHAGDNNPGVGYQCIIRFKKRDYPEPGHGISVCFSPSFCPSGYLDPSGVVPGDRTGYLDPTSGLQCVRDYTQTCDLRAPHGKAVWTDDKGAGSFQVDGLGQYPSGDSYGYFCVADPRVTDLPPPGDPNRGVMCALNNHGECDAYWYDQPCNMAEAAAMNFYVPTSAGESLHCVPNPICSNTSVYPEMVGGLSVFGGPAAWLKTWAGQCGRAAVCTDAMFDAIKKLDALNDFAKVCRQSLPAAMTMEQYCSISQPNIYGLGTLQQSACAIAQKMALSDFCSLPASTGAGVEMAQREVCASPVGGWN